MIFPTYLSGSMTKNDVGKVENSLMQNASFELDAFVARRKMNKVF